MNNKSLELSPYRQSTDYQHSQPFFAMRTLSAREVFVPAKMKREKKSPRSLKRDLFLCECIDEWLHVLHTQMKRKRTRQSQNHLHATNYFCILCCERFFDEFPHRFSKSFKFYFMILMCKHPPLVFRFYGFNLNALFIATSFFLSKK